MLQMMEAEERRPTPATGKAAQPTLDYDSHHDADGQHQTGAVERQGPLRGCCRAPPEGVVEAGLRAPLPIHDGYSPR